MIVVSYRKNPSTATFSSSVEVPCAEGVEDISSDESVNDGKRKKLLEKKLNRMGYEEKSESSSESSSESEEEESTGELLIKGFVKSTEYSPCQSLIQMIAVIAANPGASERRRTRRIRNAAAARASI